MLGFNRPRRQARLAASVVLSVVLLPAARAAEITVDDDCTLPDAITAANTDSATGSCPPGAGADVLTLTQDVQLSAVDNETEGSNGLPVITSEIVIEGAGHTVERSAGSPAFRILFVDAAGDLTLRNTTVGNGSDLQSGNGGAGIYSRGALVLELSTLQDHRSYYSGGGLANVGGEAMIIDSTVTGNTAYVGAGILNDTSRGQRGSLTIVDSSVSDNFGYGSQSVNCCSGVANAGDLTISGSTISDNTSGGGSGIANFSNGTAALYDSTVSANSGAYGGGISNGGTLGISGSTISGNSASFGYLDVGRGAGMYNFGIATLTNATLSQNVANGAYGGGLANYGSATLLNVTLSGNSSNLGGGGIFDRGSTYLENTLIADSPDGGNCDGPVVDDGGNLADDATCGTIPATLSGLDPALADNGGPTLTHALLPGSNAIDLAGDCGLATDQRGVPREIPCDSGAFEFGSGQTPVGGSVQGLAQPFVLCRNLTTGQQESTRGASWDCGALGLEFDSGDRIGVSVFGPATGAERVAATVEGLVTPLRWQCRNGTTGQQIARNTAMTSFDCETAGLQVSPGDRIRIGVGSFAE